MENKWMPNKPNHLLVNEYNPGQGIMPHIGNVSFFSL
jgi:alkylated DNA repair dioxygenase AlkB